MNEDTTPVPRPHESLTDTFVAIVEGTASFCVLDRIARHDFTRTEDYERVLASVITRGEEILEPDERLELLGKIAAFGRTDPIRALAHTTLHPSHGRVGNPLTLQLPPPQPKHEKGPAL